MADPTLRRPRLTGDTITAVLAAALVYAAFIWNTIATPMPTTERWAALTIFGLLTLALTLQGSATIYDGLGFTVRRDWRALAVLVALLPTLYLSYSTAVREFDAGGLIAAVLFAALPTLLLLQGQGRRLPTLTDLVAFVYLLLSLSLPLLPTLAIPRLGGQIDFFAYTAAPLLLVLLAARAWSGLGFTWFLTARDLRLALLTAIALLVLLVPLLGVVGFPALPRANLTSATAVVDLLAQAILSYMLIAVPAELLFRGFLQRGLHVAGEYLLRQEHRRQHEGSGRQATLRRHLPAILAVLLAAIVFGASHIPGSPAPLSHALLAACAGIGYGYVYQQTGKSTASAATHMLVVWLLALFGYSF